MKRWMYLMAGTILAGSAGPLNVSLGAEQASTLCLVPFPKKVQIETGAFDLNRPLVLEVAGAVGPLPARLMLEELARAGLPAPKVRSPAGVKFFIRLSPAGGGELPQLSFREQATPEDYVLRIRPDSVVVSGFGAAGLFYGSQTLGQLIRANRQGGKLPALTIEDWPSLRWRGFQDDITRGPCSTLEELQRETALGATLKMNFFTYYMEHQFAFKKHPDIAPPNGALTPAELKALVAYAEPRHMAILGNQQSLAHCDYILHLKPYEHLRETPWMLSPVKEETYQFLDDLYSEVMPLLPFPFFNINCDEAGGLDRGPSKTLAEQIGEGGVYVRHICRVRDLIKNKYDKRIMMWGDIILKHPQNLKEIPRDVIMLAWIYRAQDSFEKEIIPFAQSGYEFFVCPGVNNWGRIVPDFQEAIVNIHNFVRDGVKHGAIGMLNTAWDDGGETLNAPNWPGYAWGAECAWNASATTPEDFNRRLGAVLFGEKGEHFGQAVALLAKAGQIPGLDMNSQRFWEPDLGPVKRSEIAAIKSRAEQLLALARPAIKLIQACRQEATVNADLLDYFLYAARRLELLGQRMLDGLEAEQTYEQARKVQYMEGGPLVERAAGLMKKNRDAHAELGRQFQELWLRENKPYALDWTVARYDYLVATYAALADRLAAAAEHTAKGKPLPSSKEMRLEITE